MRARTSGFQRLATGEIIYPWSPEERADLSLRARIFRHRAGMNPTAAAELAVKERLAEGCNIFPLIFVKERLAEGCNIFPLIFNPSYLKE